MQSCRCGDLQLAIVQGEQEQNGSCSLSAQCVLERCVPRGIHKESGGGPTFETKVHSADGEIEIDTRINSSTNATSSGAPAHASVSPMGNLRCSIWPLTFS